MKLLKQIASLNSKKRFLKRLEARELTDINKKFDELCINFGEVLFGVSWDNNKALDELKVFQDFNITWIEWAEQWNKNHVTKANVNAFYELNINNNI